MCLEKLDAIGGEGRLLIGVVSSKGFEICSMVEDEEPAWGSDVQNESPRYTQDTAIIICERL